MTFNLIKLCSLLSTLLAIFTLIYLRVVYKNEFKTKQMSKSAYVLLVAFFLQAISLLSFAFFSFQTSHFIIGSVLILSVLSPYILGRVIKDFDKVNYFIYLQIIIFSLDLVLINF